MRKLLILLATLSMTGCANTEWLTKTYRSGYKPYDPCIRCGEKWDQLPNEPFEAQRRRAKGEQW